MRPWNFLFETNTFVWDLPGLKSLENIKCCGAPHEHLSGLFLMPFGSAGRIVCVWKTTLAGRYPPRFCRYVAQLFNNVAPSATKRDVGEQEIKEFWKRCLGSKEPQVSSEIPRCPRRTVREWESAVGFKLDDGSWARRQQFFKEKGTQKGSA